MGPILLDTKLTNKLSLEQEHHMFDHRQSAALQKQEQMHIWNLVAVSAIRVERRRYLSFNEPEFASQLCSFQVE